MSLQGSLSRVSRMLQEECVKKGELKMSEENEQKKSPEEIQAELKLKAAETRKTEAEARKTEAEASKIGRASCRERV